MIISKLSIALAAALAAADAPPDTENDAVVRSPRESAVQLDVVVVLGSRSPEPLQQVVGSITRIDSDTLERHGVQDLAGLLRFTPGLEVPGDADRFGTQGVNIRGLEGNRVGMEIDGIPLPDAFGVGAFARAGRDMVELGLVDRVEILRGPASTLYGSKALAGVLAYWTPDPWAAEPYAGQLMLGAGTRDHGRQVGLRQHLGSADGRWAGVVLVGQRRGNEIENRADNPAHAANPADYQRRAVLTKVGFDGGSAGRWTLTAEHGEGEQQTDVVSMRFGPGRFSTTTLLLADDHQTRQRFSLQADWDSVGRIGPVQLLLYRQDSRSEQFSEQYRLPDRATRFPSRRDRSFDMEQDSVGAELTAQWRGELLGRPNWMVFGVDVAHHDYLSLRDGRETNLLTGNSSNVILGEVLPVRDFPPSSVRELGVFWQDEITLAPAWALVPGLRWERYDMRARPDAMWLGDNPTAALADIGDSRLTPKLGLRWQQERLVVFAQAVAGYRAPPFSDVNIGLNLPAFNYVALPNPDLRAERSLGYEAGLRWRGEALQAELLLFSNHFRDLIESRANLGLNGDGQLVFQSQNRDRARIRGVELSARLDLGRINDAADGWWLSLAAASARGRDLGRDLPLNSVAPERGVLAAGFDAADGRWGAELLLSGVRSVRHVEHPGTGPLFLPPGYSRWDGVLWWQPMRALRLNLQLDNLGDRRYWEWNSLRGLPANASNIDFYSRPGRSAALQARFEW